RPGVELDGPAIGEARHPARLRAAEVHFLDPHLRVTHVAGDRVAAHRTVLLVEPCVHAQPVALGLLELAAALGAVEPALPCPGIGLPRRALRALHRLDHGREERARALGEGAAAAVAGLTRATALGD